MSKSSPFYNPEIIESDAVSKQAEQAEQAEQVEPEQSEPDPADPAEQVDFEMDVDMDVDADMAMENVSKNCELITEKSIENILTDLVENAFFRERHSKKINSLEKYNFKFKRYNPEIIIPLKHREVFLNAIILFIKNKKKSQVLGFTVDEDFEPVFETEMRYFGNRFIVLPKLKFWSYKFLNGVREVRGAPGIMKLLDYDLGKIENNIEMFKTPDEVLIDCYKNPLKTGTIREMLQSGHSFLISTLIRPLVNTFRGYIYADVDNLPTTLTMSLPIAKQIFNINSTGIFVLPANITIYIKRDPVIWLGGIQPITHLKIENNNNDSSGISPFTFESMNMDVDGDTFIGEIVLSINAKIEQKRFALSPLITMNSGLRWSLSTNYIISFYSLLVRDVEMPEWTNYILFADYSHKFSNQKLWMWWDWCRMYDQHEQTPTFVALTRKYIKILYYVEYLDDFWNWMIEIVKYPSFSMSRPENFRENYLLQVIINSGIKNENIDKLQLDFDRCNDRNEVFDDMDEQLFESCETYKNTFINLSRNLPKESFETSKVFNNLQFLQYSKNNLYYLGELVYSDVAETFSLDFITDPDLLYLFIDEILADMDG